MHLGRELGGVLQVVAEQLAETAELGLAGILGAELEGLVGGRLVHELQTGVVLEDVQDSAVCLPQELEPWRDDGTVGVVARLLAGDGGEEDGLGRLGSLQVVDVLVVRGLKRGLDLVCLGLGLCDLLLGEFDEALEDSLQRVSPGSRHVSLGLPYLDSADVCVLGRVLVLVQTILGQLALA